MSRRNRRPGAALLTALMAGAALVALAAPSWAAWAPSEPRGTARLQAVSAASPTDAWAVGFYQEQGHNLGLTWHWDGTRWRNVESVRPLEHSFVWGVADVSAADAWAVGEAIGGASLVPFIEHWDGSAWTEVHFRRPGLGKLTAASASGPDDVWMSGTRYDNPFQTPRPVVAHWNGTGIRVMHTARMPKAPSVELESISSVEPNDVWVVGAHGRHGQTYLPLVEHYDGTAWTIVPGDPVQGRNGDLTGVDASSSSDAWSVGWYVKAGEQTISAFAQHWDGSVWTQSPVPSPGYASSLSSVDVVAPDDVWAVGSWQTAIQASTSRPLVLHWDGSTWTRVSAPHNPHVATSIESVSMDSGSHGFAVGNANGAARTRPYLIHWNGTAWAD